jgi:hypothetical protein
MGDKEARPIFLPLHPDHVSLLQKVQLAIFRQPANTKLFQAGIRQADRILPSVCKDESVELDQDDPSSTADPGPM